MSYSNLDQFLQISGRICEKAALSVMLQLAQGLSYLSERNICHRDIKPSNILISSKGIPHIM